MKMPLTAIVLTLELTRVGHDFLFPIALAVAGSIAMLHLLSERRLQPTWSVRYEDIPTGNEAADRKGVLVP